MSFLSAIAFWRKRAPAPVLPPPSPPPSAPAEIDAPPAHLLSMVEQLLAAVRTGIDASQAQAIVGFALTTGCDAYWRSHRGTDPRPSSLLDSFELLEALPDAEGVRTWRSEFNLKIRPGLDKRVLRDRWGHSSGFYIVSPTHQGSAPRAQDLTTETFSVNGVEIFVMNSRQEVVSLTVKFGVSKKYLVDTPGIAKPPSRPRMGETVKVTYSLPVPETVPFPRVTVQFGHALVLIQKQSLEDLVLFEDFFGASDEAGRLLKRAFATPDSVVQGGALEAQDLALISQALETGQAMIGSLDAGPETLISKVSITYEGTGADTEILGTIAYGFEVRSRRTNRVIEIPLYSVPWREPRPA